MVQLWKLLNDRSASRRAAVLTIVAGAIVLVGAAVIAYAEHSQYSARVQAQVVSDVSEVRAELEAALANRLVLPDALVALAVARDGDVAQEFEAFAEGLATNHRSYLGQMGDDPAIRSLQFAPDAVVTYVFPLEGNEAAIGHDLLADPERGPAVQRAIDERRFVLAGPFELLQGGTGLVGRAPIYLERGGAERFWGFATIVLNFDEIAPEAGLASPQRNGLVYALRGRDGLGANGEVFWGDAHVFDHDPAVLSVLVPNGTWQVAAHPADGWPLFPFRTTSLLILTIGMGLATFVVTFILRWERARRTVERVSDNLTRLVDSTTSPIVAIDPDDRISEWNRAMAEITGVTQEEALGARSKETCSDICSDPEESSAFQRAIESVRTQSLTSREVTMRIGTPVRTVAFTATPRVESDGRLGVVCLGHDVTARLEAERAHAENLALARSARLKDQFLAAMSHELRTPLNAIIGLSKVLERRTFGDLTDKQATYVTQIGVSGEHLLELINDVLDLARLEAAQVELELETCDLTELIGESLDLIRPVAEKQEITIADVPTDQGPVVVADRRRMRQILVNLLSNAVKFTETGGSCGVEVAGRADQATIVVWDTGIGIPADKQHLLFQPFVQVDGSLSREREGSGLGLAIAASLVRLHSGDISVECPPSGGTRFTMTIPVSGPPATAEPVSDPFATGFVSV